MSEITELLSKSKYNEKNIKSSMEPDTSKAELLKLELFFHINTTSILSGNQAFRKSVPNAIIKKWISLYDTFSFFGGKDIEINSNPKIELPTITERWYGEGDLAEIYHIGNRLFFYMKQSKDRFRLDTKISYEDAKVDAYKVIPFNIDDVPSNAAGSPFM